MGVTSDNASYAQLANQFFCLAMAGVKPPLIENWFKSGGSKNFRRRYAGLIDRQLEGWDEEGGVFVSHCVAHGLCLLQAPLL